jgi:hypothetical protein
MERSDMTKKDLAAEFFAKLGQDSGEFVTKMIEAEMDPEIIDVFNKFGGQLTLGDMDPKRFHSSLLIIGYLVRAHEEAAVKKESTSQNDEELSQDPIH